MVTLTFTDDQFAVLSRALIELPYKDAAPLMDDINRQITEARQAAADKLNEQRNRNRDESNALPLITAADLPTT